MFRSSTFSRIPCLASAVRFPGFSGQRRIELGGRGLAVTGLVLGYLQAALVVLALVGVKLLIEHWVHVSPVTSLLVVLIAFAIGIWASVRAEKKEAPPTS